MALLEAPADINALLLARLVADGVLDDAAARRAKDVCASARESLVAVLHQLALADDLRVARAVAALHDLPLLDASEAPDAALALSDLATAFLRRHRLLPLRLANGVIDLAVVDPSDREGVRAVAFAAAAEPRLHVMALGDWRDVFARLYGEEPIAVPDAKSLGWTDDTARVRDSADAAPAVRLVDALLDRALDAGASDIHIEPMADRVRIRLRIDGALRTIAEEPAALGPSIAARIKVLADMDVANRRAPQDGRTSLAARGKPIDVRISTVPSSFGETVALRLLRRDPALLDLDRLGFAPELSDLLRRVIQMRRGIFLVTGPTGSGKTTTLYAMIEQLRADALKILSIEDPIEYFFTDVTQTQVNEEAGVSFASALRAFLRQDPDVILVGEIRDSETARIAVQAALTGHLVLSTLHTIDAASAIERLVDMGVDRYLVGATLTGVMAQRLVTRLCPHCKAPRPASAAEQTLLSHSGHATSSLAHADGCARCRGSGRHGRLAIAEGFLVDNDIRTALAEGRDLRSALATHGFADLSRDAARLAATGEIDAAEIAALAQG